MVLHSLSEGPAEAAGARLVDTLEEEQYGPDFEDRGANEGGDTSSCSFLICEQGGGFYKRQKYEEGVYAPYDAAECEEGCHVVGYVPYGKRCEHADDALCHSAEGGRRSGCGVLWVC